MSVRSGAAMGICCLGLPRPCWAAPRPSTGTGVRPPRRSTSSPVTTGSRLADVVSYNEKHNEANGEGNRDGHTARTSRTISASRGRRPIRSSWPRAGGRQRAMLATLFFSQGIPMLLGWRRDRQYPARQQQCLCPGQRDRLGRLEKRRREAARLRAAPRRRCGASSRCLSQRNFPAQPRPASATASRTSSGGTPMAARRQMRTGMIMPTRWVSSCAPRRRRSETPGSRRYLCATTRARRAGLFCLRASGCCNSTVPTRAHPRKPSARPTRPPNRSVLLFARPEPEAKPSKRKSKES